MAEAEKVILIVDWENLRHRIDNNKLLSCDKVDFNNPNDIYNLLLSFLLKEEEIFRIMFYVAYFPKEYKQTYKNENGEIVNIGREEFKKGFTMAGDFGL